MKLEWILLLLFGMLFGFISSYGTQRDRFRNEAMKAKVAYMKVLESGEVQFKFKQCE